jgi:5-methylcytosine-specific restriction endonuclease McrA
MRFKLEEFHRNIDENTLLEDLKTVCEMLREINTPLTYRSYNENGKYSSATIVSRFGTWNGALKKAGLNLNEEKNVSDKDLFKNLEEVWTSLGRQPVTRELTKPLSKYASSIYSERFGSWRKSLEAFMQYVNGDEKLEESTQESKNSPEVLSLAYRRTNRNISDRMRFRILSRDGFTCQSCGASPIKERGVELHVDHILPWSKGGETIEENLQAKCKQCNLGKGNAFNQ